MANDIKKFKKIYSEMYTESKAPGKIDAKDVKKAAMKKFENGISGLVKELYGEGRETIGDIKEFVAEQSQRIIEETLYNN